MANGFVAWFEGLIYNVVRNACKNMMIKLLVHTAGLLLILVGLYFFIAAPPSFIGVAGLVLIFIGSVTFVIPLGVK